MRTAVSVHTLKRTEITAPRNFSVTNMLLWKEKIVTGFCHVCDKQTNDRNNQTFK